MDRSFDNQSFTQQLLLNAIKRYKKQRRKRNITVWLVVSAIIFWFTRTDSSDLLITLSYVGISLVLGLITCIVSLFIISFINIKIFNMEYHEAELIKLKKQYIEKFGYDNFYHDYVARESDLP